MAVVFRVRFYQWEVGPCNLPRLVKIVDTVSGFKSAREGIRESLNMGTVRRLHVKGRFWWHPVIDLDRFMRMHDARPFDSTLKRWRLPR